MNEAISSQHNTENKVKLFYQETKRWYTLLYHNQTLLLSTVIENTS